MAKTIREQLIILFKQLVLSPTYNLFWQNLSKAAECLNSPILDYHISDQIFKTILEKLKKPKVNTELENITNTPDEKGAIAYIGGYIIRAQI